MDTPFSILAIGLPLALMLAAGWPLLLLPRVRQALLYAGGACCLAGGTSLAGLLAAGVLPLPGTSASAAAQETTSAPAAPVPPSSPAAVAPPPGPVEPSEVTPSAPGESSSTEPNTDEIKIETRPDGTIIIPAGRPSWVDTAPKLAGDVHTIPVSSGPYKLPRDAQRALDAEIAQAANKYIADQLGSALAPTLLNYDTRTLKQRFVKPGNTYEETITFSEPLNEMHQSHALLTFPQSFRDELGRNWDQVRATSRLAQLGVFAGAGLLLLSSVFGYFRLDNATRGYYTGRLQFLAAAAILAIIGAGVFAARWITWL